MMKKLALLFLLLCFAEISYAAFARQARGYSYLARGGWAETADTDFGAGWVAARAADADWATQWLSDNVVYPHWWQADMAGAQNITFVHYYASSRVWDQCDDADFYMSTDGIAWGGSLWNGDLTAGTVERLYLIDGFDETKRYFRLVGNSGPVFNHMGTRELMAGDGVPWIATAENWRWGAGNDGAWRSIVFDETYYWESTTATAWLAYDFQVPKSFSAIEIISDGSGAHAPANVAVYESADGIAWGAAIVDVATNPALDEQFVSLARVVTTRYLKMIFTKPPANLIIEEFYTAIDDTVATGVRHHSQVY